MGRVVRGGRVVPAERVRALQASEELLEQARGQAAALVEAARAEADQVRDQARAQGRREAQEEAVAVLAAARSARERLLGSCQGDVVTLALEVARKVLGAELELRPGLVVELCEGALRRLALASSLSLRVNPADLDLVTRSAPQLAAALDRGASLRLLGDEAVGRGGCVVESDLGRIDARLETQLAAIERALRAEDG